MLGFIKKVFFTGLTILSTLSNVNLFKCISINNQECKVRPEVVNFNSNDPVFYPFSTKTRKCSGSEADGYIKEKNGNKYLIFNSADNNKEVLKK